MLPNMHGKKGFPEGSQWVFAGFQRCFLVSCLSENPAGQDLRDSAQRLSVDLLAFISALAAAFLKSPV